MTTTYQSLNKATDNSFIDDLDVNASLPYLDRSAPKSTIFRPVVNPISPTDVPPNPRRESFQYGYPTEHGRRNYASLYDLR